MNTALTSTPSAIPRIRHRCIVGDELGSHDSDALVVVHIYKVDLLNGVVKYKSITLCDRYKHFETFEVKFKGLFHVSYIYLLNILACTEHQRTFFCSVLKNLKEIMRLENKYKRSLICDIRLSYMTFLR